MAIDPVGVGIAVVFFLVGVYIVIESVEIFVETVGEAALELGVSSFFLTVLLAGTDVENVVLGIVAVSDDLPGIAIGTVFGEAFFILGAALGFTAFVAPFKTDVPRHYLAMMLGTPVVFVVFALDGVLSRLEGVVLALLFIPVLGLVYWLEARSATRYLSAEEVVLEDDEADEDDEEFIEELFETIAEWVGVDEYSVPATVIAVLTIVGMTVGSELAVIGARDLLVVLGVSGLAFGATVLSFIASIEEMALTLEPVRRDQPHLAIGNVVGSMLFFTTANAGVIAAIQAIETSGPILSSHLPFFVATLVLTAVLMVRGRFNKVEGGALMVIYVAYWVLSYQGSLGLA